MTEKVFVAHGHDHRSLGQLKEMLTTLGCTPMVMIHEPDVGLTFILEKFLEHANNCRFAIGLLTPDDKQADKLSESERYRARQNVILEIGWFLGRLGRQDVVLLHKGKVELPSDLLGILYLPFQKEVGEVKGRLEEMLIRRGVIKPAALRQGNETR